MEKFIFYSRLFDIYKKLFTEKNQEIFRLYYEENLSMGEIAENLGVSRSYIGSVLKKMEKKLDYFEADLQILEKNSKLIELLEEQDPEKIKEELKKIIF